MALARFIVAALHETGHAAACVAAGHRIVEWHPLLGGRGPHTVCPPITWPIAAAGTLMSMIAWLSATAVFVGLLGRLRTARLLVAVFVAMLWFGWSLWFFEELGGDTIHAYRDVPLNHDAGYFVHLTGINPDIAGGVMLAVIAILLWPFVRVCMGALRALKI